MSTSQILPPKAKMQLEPSSARHQAEAEQAASQSSTTTTVVSENTAAGEVEQVTDLDTRIAAIFGFETQEDVLAGLFAPMFRGTSH